MSLERVAEQAGIPVAAVKVTAKWEGCLKKVGPDQYGPYPCPARVPTIGIGTTVYNEIGKKVSLSDQPITRARAEDLLAFDLGKKYAPSVRRAVKTGKFKSDNQYAACISFAYNVGTGGFSKSTLCWLINNGQYERAANEFLRWTRGGGRVLPGLVSRRKDERKLFLTPGAAYSDSRAPQAAAEVKSTPSSVQSTQPSFWSRLIFWRR